MEDLQNDLKELMDQMEEVEELINNIDEAYLDTIDDVQDQFDKQIEDYEYINDLIESNMDLLEIMYGEKNYNAMQNYYDMLQYHNSSYNYAIFLLICNLHLLFVLLHY